MKLIDLLVRELPKRGGWPEGFVTAWQSEHDCEVYFCKPDNSTTLNTRSLYAGLLNEASDCRGIRGSVTRTKYEAALAAKNDGWIEWGGELVSLADVVEARTKGGDVISGLHNLRHHNMELVAYRLRKSAEVKPEWNGEGLPPVGCECEFTNGPYRAERGEFSGIIPTEGQSVEVVAHKVTSDDNEVAVVYWDDSGEGRSACFVPECFRPLRTEADRKRDAAIAKLTNAICGEIPDTGMATSAKYAERVYSSIAAGKIPGVKLDG